MILQSTCFKYLASEGVSIRRALPAAAAANLKTSLPQTTQNNAQKETMMFLWVVVSLAAAARAQEELSWCESCVRVEAACYNVSYVLDLNATFRKHVLVHEMGVRRADNTLFYAFEPPIEDKEYYKVAYVNLDDPEQDGVISDNNIHILNFGTFDIDQDNSIVYLGGSDGIFSYDKDKNLKVYSSRGDSIGSIFYKGFVFFTASNETKLIKRKVGDAFEPFFEDNLDVKNFVVTKYNVVVYLTKSGLFLKKNDERVYLSKNAFFRGLTIDLDGSVYAWWVDGIYKVVVTESLDKSHVVKVAHIPSVGAVTFDNDNNILFNSGRELYRLSKTANTTDCKDEIRSL